MTFALGALLVGLLFVVLPFVLWAGTRWADRDLPWPRTARAFQKIHDNVLRGDW